MLFTLCIGILFYTAKGFDFYPTNLHRCQMIPSNFSLCFGLGYTQMYLPNLLNHESITEILYELPLWQSLLTLGCHPHARLLLCSILAPVCIQQTPERRSKLVSFDNNPSESMSSTNPNNKKFLYPCRHLCESVKQSCESRMIAQFGYRWPTMISCDQYPEGTELCVAPSMTTSTATTTTEISSLTTLYDDNKSFDLCHMCESRVTTNDLLNDYCRSTVVLRTRPVRNSSISQNNFVFAHKQKVRYFKNLNPVEMQQIRFDFPLKICSCIKLSSPTILFIGPDDNLIRFISVKNNPRVFKRFRNTIVLRKPRCQHRSSSAKN